MPDYHELPPPLYEFIFKQEMNVPYQEGDGKYANKELTVYVDGKKRGTHRFGSCFGGHADDEIEDDLYSWFRDVFSGLVGYNLSSDYLRADDLIKIFQILSQAEVKIVREEKSSAIDRKLKDFDKQEAKLLQKLDILQKNKARLRDGKITLIKERP